MDQDWLRKIQDKTKKFQLPLAGLTSSVNLALSDII